MGNHMTKEIAKSKWKCPILLKGLPCTGAPLRGGYPPQLLLRWSGGAPPPTWILLVLLRSRGGNPPPAITKAYCCCGGGHLPLALREALLWRRPGREHLRFRTDELLLLRGGNPPHPSDLLLLRGGHPPQGCDQLLLLRWGGEPICIVLNRGSRTSIKNN